MKKNRGNSTHRHLAFEQCEDRRLLAVYQVTNAGDADVGTPAAVGTLRQAIEDANTNLGPDQIIFDLPADSTITLTEGQLFITDAVEIIGTGWDDLTIDASGNDPTPNSTPIDIDPNAGPFDPPAGEGDGSRVFRINTFGAVTLSGMTITGGDLNFEDGAGIQHTGGDLTLSRVVVRENNSTYGTAGIESTVGSNRTLKIENSIIEENISLSRSSALSIDNRGNVVIDNSQIVNNQMSSAAIADPDSGVDESSGTVQLFTRDGAATLFRNTTIADNQNYVGSGGGIGLETFGTGVVDIINTTVSGNSSKFDGGGIYINSIGTGGSIGVRHSTVFGNTVQNLGPSNSFVARGGGIAFAVFDGLTIEHSIVANNVDLADPLSDEADLSYTTPAGSLIDASYNVITQVPTDMTLSGGVTPAGNNQIADPMVSVLQDNGGVVLRGRPALTHAPEANSPAVDAGDPIYTESNPPSYVEGGQTLDLDYDQRRLPYQRVVDQDPGGAQIDIGALERQGEPGEGVRVTDVIVSSSISLDPDYSFDAIVTDEQDQPQPRTGVQLDRVPIAATDTITIRFTQPIDVTTDPQAVDDALTLFGTDTQNRPTRVGGATVSPDGLGLTWRFSGWAMGDHYSIRLDADAITNESGTHLDGEWTNPINRNVTNLAVSTFPSGDGTAGGDFVFVATLLPGDFNGDGDVDIIDFGLFSDGFNAGLVTAGFLDGDYDGDGDVDIQDFGIFADNFPSDLTGDLLLLANLDPDPTGAYDVDVADEAIWQLGQSGLDEDFFYGWLGFEGVA